MNRAIRRPGGNWSVSRIGKPGKFAVILYEIDMLRFTYAQILRPREGSRNADVWVYLEAFLVHYRNLLDFFGKRAPNRSNLSISRPDDIWPEEEGLADRMCQGRSKTRPLGRRKSRPEKWGEMGFAGRGGWSGGLRSGLPDRV